MRIVLIFLLFLAGCEGVWNDPYPASERGQNILYSVFAERPKHLDPACRRQWPSAAGTAGPLNGKSYRQRTRMANLFGEARKLPELHAFSFKSKACTSAHGQVIVDPCRE